MSSKRGTETVQPQPSVGSKKSAAIPSDVVAAASSTATTEYVRLRVSNDTVNELQFNVKVNTELGRLKKSYSKKMGLDMEELRFVFEGQRIVDTDTPRLLGLENDDIIEVYQPRIGGTYLCNVNV